MSQDPTDDAPKGVELNLEDLPDEADADPRSEAIGKARARLAARRMEETQRADPRRQALEGLSNGEKMAFISGQWVFDRGRVVWGPLLTGLVPVVLKYAWKAAMPGDLPLWLSLAELYAALFWCWVRPWGITERKAVLGFDGPDLPRWLLPPAGFAPERVRCKWAQVRRVEKTGWPSFRLWGEGDRELGELRWDLFRRDKKRVGEALRALVGPKHPLRAAVEKEIGYGA